MDKILPTELLHAICSFLPIPAVQNIRLVNSLFADLAAEFLIPEVHLIFTAESIDRLTYISLHPIISQHVKSLLYEADRLNYYQYEYQWFHHVHDNFWGASGPPRLPWGNDPHKLDATRATYCHWMRSPKHSYSEQQLEVGWLEFQALFLQQEDTETLEAEISSAIARFPKLGEIRLSIDGEIDERSKYLGDAFAGGLVGPTGPYRIRNLQPPGFLALKSVLSGLAVPQGPGMACMAAQKSAIPSSLAKAWLQVTTITTLQLGSVNPFAFRALESNTGKVAHEVFKSLRHLKLVLGMGEFEDYEVITNGQESLHELESGFLKNFLAEATLLRTMSITFVEFYSDWMATDLACILGDHKWEFLEEISLGGFQTEPQYLLDFFCRHQDPLKDIAIEDFRLIVPRKENVWAQLLLDVRNLKQWRQVTLYGTLCRGVPAGDDWRSEKGENLHEEFFAGFRNESFDEHEHTTYFREELRDFALRYESRNPFVHFWNDKSYVRPYKTIYDADDYLEKVTEVEEDVGDGEGEL